LAKSTTVRERLQILAAHYEQENDLTHATGVYRELIKDYPHEMNSYFQLGLAYGNQSLLPEKSVEVFNQGLSIEPATKTLLNLKAYCLAWLGRKQDALHAVNQYINIAPAEPNPYDTQGDIYAWFREYDLSRDAYQKALALRSDFSSLEKLGYYALLRQNFSEADRDFQNTGIPSALPSAYRGMVREAMKKISNLPQSQNTAVQKLYVLTSFSYEAALYPKMLEYARQLMAQIKKDPTDVLYGRDYFAWALLKNGKTTEAHTILDEMQNDVRGKPVVLKVTADFASGLISLEEGKNELALEQFRNACGVLPPNHEPSLFYAVALIKNGQTSEAIQELQRLLYWPPSSDLLILPNIPGSKPDWPVPAVRAHYWLGVVYEQQGEKEAAMKEYETFLNIWKNADFKSDEIADAKTRLAKLKRMAP
jgi:tetratricopeptide (TPR) repeat protein